MSSDDEAVDAQVDVDIAGYLAAKDPKSFFLFAGAGSGKTRSLVSALRFIREQNGHAMRLRGQQVAVITYTNAACDEIKARLDFDPLVWVSTIHSFIWELIHGFTSDIRTWLEKNLAAEIEELLVAQGKARGVTKTSIARERSIESKKKRLQLLPSFTRFVYSPTGENRTRDSLNHAEVIKLGAHFLETKKLMQDLLVCRFPLLLIDESQDTNGLLLTAFFAVQAANKSRFLLGLFGDTMQRIYNEGKSDLGDNLPADWAKPAKKMNHRCPKRVVTLINKIRASTDRQVQQARSDAAEGHIRLFVCPTNVPDKFGIEAKSRNRMATIANDPQWDEINQVKTLILEHHMAAKRMGFYEMYHPLYEVEDFKIGLRDGSLPALSFFAGLVLPLVLAERDKNSFAMAAMLRKHSPLLSKKALIAAGNDQMSMLKAAKSATDTLMALDPLGKASFLTILQSLAASKLFDIPESLFPFASSASAPAAAADDGADAATARLDAINRFLSTPFAQIEAYSTYAAGRASIDTHQGVKGLEFPRVMVIMDDEDAGGNFFSYEKLFGAKPPSAGDAAKSRAGQEIGLDKTRRLFYVTCSRSKSSLALLAYSENPEAVRKTVLTTGWFDEEEIEMIA